MIAKNKYTIIALALIAFLAGLNVYQGYKRRIELSAKEELWNLCRNTHDEIAILRPDGTILLWSKGAEKGLGWTLADVIDKRPENILMDNEKWKKQHRKSSEEFMRSDRVGGGPILCQFVRKDGSIAMRQNSFFKVLKDGESYILAYLKEPD